MNMMFGTEGIAKSDRMLHTPGAFAKNNLLYVQEVGTLTSLKPHVCRRENVDSYLIFEVEHGEGTLTTEGKTYQLRKGDCIWIDCHNAFEHISSSKKGWNLAWVHFNGAGAKAFYELFREKNVEAVFVTEEAEEVSKAVRNIFQKMSVNASEIEIHVELTRLLAACVEQVSQKDVMAEVREFINVHYQTQDLRKVLADKFEKTVEVLDEEFTKSYGIGLRDYILNRRFNAAKELLRFTIQPISEVIEDSGILNEDLFYQLFKENENMTPEEYRRRWAQWIKD